MTLYVQLQEKMYALLKHLKKHDPEFLQRLVAKCCLESPVLNWNSLAPFITTMKMARSDHEWIDLLMSVDEVVARSELFINSVRDLVDAADPADIKILNMRGARLYHRDPVGYGDYVKSIGSGENALRNEFLSQPRVLKKGDVLATGEALLSDPREGGNGSVLLHLSHGKDGIWISVAGRLPIALYHPSFNAPSELFEKSK